MLQVTAVDFTLKKFLLPLIDGMSAEGYEVHTACHKGNISKELEDEGYVIHHIPFERNLNLKSHLISIKNLVQLIKKEKYDCVHTHTPVASILARIAAKIAGVPLVIYTAHGFYFHENMKPIVYKVAYLIEKIFGKYFSDYIFFQSIEDYQLALTNHFNKSDRLIHISNGVSRERFNPELFNREKIREELGFRADDIVIMFLARLVREKGVNELIDAFARIKGQGISRAKLMIVGGQVVGDRDGFDIEEKLAQLPNEVRDSISLMGLRDDIPALLAACDFFTLPSYREGLPRSIIEAMAMAKPIIATNIRGCREEVFTEENGYLCEPKDAHYLAEKMLLLIENPDKRRKFGQRSRSIFLERFDEEVVIRRQVDVLRKYEKEGIKNV